MRQMSLLVASALVLPSLAFGQKADQTQVQYSFDTRRPDAAQKLAQAVAGVGKVAARRGDSWYRVVVSPSGRTQFEQRIALYGFKPTRTEVVNPGHSMTRMGVSELERRVAEGKANRAKFGTGGYGVGYLEALKHFTRVRAFPNDTIDWDAISRAAKYRDAMAPWRPSVSKFDLPPAWEYVGPKNLDIPYRQYYGTPPLGGRTNAVAYNPATPSTIYAGAANGGLWRSTDSGLNWAPLSNNWPTQPINAILVTDANTIYVGLGDYPGGIAYGRGIRKSTDGGNTWTSLDAFGNIGVVDLELGAGGRLIAATGGGSDFYGGLWTSDNGGTSWTRTQNDANTAWTSLTGSLPDNNGNRVLYATSAAWNTTRLFRSNDNGSTWTALTPPGLTTNNFVWAYDVAASQTDRNRLYLLAPTERKVLQSNDQGATWTDITAGIPTGSNNYNWSQAFYNYHITVGTLPDQEGTRFDAVYVGNIDLAVYSQAFGATPWRTIGGPTFSSTVSVLHNDQHSFAVHPTDPNLGLAGNDGGVFRIAFNTTTRNFEVTPLNRTLYTHQFYHMSVHPTADNYLMGGTQDNAVPLSQGDLANWRNVGGGDGGYSAFSSADTNIQFASAQNQAIQRTSNGWTTATWINQNWRGLGQRTGFIAPYEINQGNQDQLIAGTNFAWRYNIAANTWTQLSNTELAPGDGIIHSMHTTTDPNIMYMGSSNGDLFKTIDAGVSWTRINANLPARTITSILTAPGLPHTVLLTVGGTGAGHVFYSETSATTVSWTDLSGTGAGRLPDVPTHSIVFTGTSGTWFVANDLGVFITENAGVTYQDATAPLGLPKVIVHKLAYDSRTKFLYAATFGRGIWRTNLGFTGLQSFTIVPNTLSRGQTATATGTVTMAAASTSPRTVTITRVGIPNGVIAPVGVVVPANATTATFQIGVQNATSTGAGQFRATFEAVQLSAPFTVTVPRTASITLNPATVTGGNTSTATLTLNAPALAGGTTVPVQSSNPVRATVPSSVTVPAGQTSTTFPVNTTRQASPGTSNITSQGASATLTIQTANLVSVSSLLAEGTAGSGVTYTGRVTLERGAPTGGTTIQLESANTALLTVPASVTVPAGATTTNFTITPKATVNDTNVIIYARHTVGTTTWVKSMGFRVRARYITGLTVNPTTVKGGNSVAGRITISGPAPSNWVGVAVTSSNPTVVIVPTSVGVAPGQTAANFTIRTTAVTARTDVVITARHVGKTITTTLVVVP